MTTTTPPPPQPQQQPHANEAVLTVNARTLMFATLLLGGGTVGGFSTTLLGESKLAPEVRQSIESTRTTVVSVAEKMDNVQNTVVELRAEMKTYSREAARTDESVKDHERRLRDLERLLRR